MRLPIYRRTLAAIARAFAWLRAQDGLTKPAAKQLAPILGCSVKTAHRHIAFCREFAATYTPEGASALIAEAVVRAFPDPQRAELLRELYMAPRFAFTISFPNGGPGVSGVEVSPDC